MVAGYDIASFDPSSFLRGDGRRPRKNERSPNNFCFPVTIIFTICPGKVPLSMSIDETNAPAYRWYILGLSMLTNVLASAMPGMCMPVLFDEISADLSLSLVEVGVIWGISSLPGIVTALLGGAIGDRFGPRRVLILACLLVGLTGALRGLAVDFITLALTMVLFGMFTPFITLNGFKTCGLWFPSRQMGLASGVLSMGMALGFLLSSMFSATVLSPLLGGWRSVLFLYGGIAALLAIPWALTRPTPAPTGAIGAASLRSFRANLASMTRIRSIWLFGLAIFGFGGAVQGALGYLPLFLRGQGWEPTAADSALAAFHTVSMIFVIPIALISDRLGTRKGILIPAALMAAVGFGLLSVVEGMLVWVAVLLAGIVRDGFMAVFMTAVLETEGVGPAYAGTALGLVMIFSGLGNMVAPPLGNSFATTAPGLPFLFWAFMALVGVTGLLLARSRQRQGPTPVLP